MFASRFQWLVALSKDSPRDADGDEHGVGAHMRSLEIMQESVEVVPFVLVDEGVFDVGLAWEAGGPVLAVGPGRSVLPVFREGRDASTAGHAVSRAPPASRSRARTKID